MLPALLVGLALAACKPQKNLPVAGTYPGDTKPPVAISIASMPALQVGAPAQNPGSGSQVFVDVVLGKTGVQRLTAMLELYQGEESVVSLVTLEIPAMSSGQP